MKEKHRKTAKENRINSEPRERVESRRKREEANGGRS